MVVVRKPILHSMSTNTIRHEEYLINFGWKSNKIQTIIISIFLNFDGYQSHILSEEVGSSGERYVIMFTPGGHGVNSRHIAVETNLTLLWSDNIQHYFRQHLTRGENEMASDSRRGHDEADMALLSGGRGRQLRLDFIDWIILLMTPMRKWAWPG